jgi:hypothetical protein
MFWVFVGLTAIDVSLCGPMPSQSVFTFADVCVGVVQIAVPVFVAGAVPKTALVTGAGASLTLWTNSMGSSPSPSPSSPRAVAAPSASARPSADTSSTIVSQ